MTAFLEDSQRFSRGVRRWPARLPDQPIFYPVVNEE
jgi:hypothetical protein